MPTPLVLKNQDPGTPPYGQPPPKSDHTRAGVGVTLAGFVLIAFVLEGVWAGLAIAPALLALERIVGRILRPER